MSVFLASYLSHGVLKNCARLTASTYTLRVSRVVRDSQTMAFGTHTHTLTRLTTTTTRLLDALPSPKTNTHTHTRHIYRWRRRVVGALFKEIKTQCDADRIMGFEESCYNITHGRRTGLYSMYMCGCVCARVCVCACAWRPGTVVGLASHTWLANDLLAIILSI